MMRFASGKIRWGLLALTATVLMHAFAVDASAERFRSFGRNPSLGSFGGRFGRVFINRNGERIIDGINVDRLQETGFARLKADGQNLVEVARDGSINRIILDDFGRVFGIRDPQTLTQLPEFFLNNLDKIRNNRVGNAVRRFLARQPGVGNAIFGGIAIDLKSIVQLDPKEVAFAPKGDQTPMAIAALNYVLNMLSQSARLIKMGPQNMRSDGLVGMNLNGFIRGEALAALVSNNPYSCGSGRVRLDWLITRSMDPQLYYQTIGAPQTAQQLNAQLGTEFNRRFTVADKVLIAPPGSAKEPESLVGRHTERILRAQNTRNIPGGLLFDTYDNNYNLPPGAKADSASVKINGIDTNFVAGESIFTKPNGFLGFWLANAAGQRQNSAPVEIAQNTKQLPHLGADVSAGPTCLRCHNNGLVGAGVMLKQDGEKPTRYTDNFNLLTQRGLNRQGHFIPNAVYDQGPRARGSRIFRNALIRSGSFWPDPTSPDKNTGEVGAADLINNYANGYRAPVTMTAAARELGTTPQAAAAMLRRGVDGTIQREEFERLYCTLRQQVAQGGTPGGAPQTPIDSRRVASAQPATGPVTATSGVAHLNGQQPVGSSSRPVAQ